MVRKAAAGGWDLTGSYKQRKQHVTKKQAVRAPTFAHNAALSSHLVKEMWPQVKIAHLGERKPREPLLAKVRHAELCPLRVGELLGEVAFTFVRSAEVVGDLVGGTGDVDST